MAREHAPSIIFMDEIDSIGSSRGESGSGGGDSEVQRTMLELLNQLDGFEATKNIKVRWFRGRSMDRPELSTGHHGDEPYRHPRLCPAEARPDRQVRRPLRRRALVVTLAQEN
jgi:SpoVK/Ycf46/Vps4 family AAA+-type ATPase